MAHVTSSSSIGTLPPGEEDGDEAVDEEEVFPSGVKDREKDTESLLEGHDFVGRGEDEAEETPEELLEDPAEPPRTRLRSSKEEDENCFCNTLIWRSEGEIQLFLALILV